MKILHIINGLGDGGAERALVNLCSKDQDNTHIVVSLMRKSKYDNYLIEKKIEVYNLNINKYIFSAFNLIRLYLIIKKKSPDIVQTWLYHSDLLGGLIAKLAKIKIIIWNIRHSDVATNKLKYSTKLIIKICSYVSSSIPTKIIFCSKVSMNNHIKIGYPKTKMSIIYNGVDLNLFKPINDKILKTELKITEKNPIIGMVARYSPYKDFNTLIKALSILKKEKINFKCLLVGKNINKKNLNLLAEIKKYSLDNDIELLGQKDNIVEIMNIIDLGILSSFSESFPNVVAEFMAMKKPVIASDQGEAKNIIGDTGWIVRSNNANELADLIKRALIEFNDKDFWSKRCNEARERINSFFSLKKMIAEYNLIWKKDLLNQISLEKK